MQNHFDITKKLFTNQQISNRNAENASQFRKFIGNLSILFLTFFLINKYFLPLRGTIIDHSFKKPSHEKSVQGLLKKVEAEKPKVIFVGNSMLGSSVHPEQFSMLSGVPTTNIETGGTASAWWFLAIKNVVMRASQKPALIAIFFRDTDLTSPEYRAIEYKKSIDLLAGDREPVLDKLAYLNQMDPITEFLASNMAMFQKRHQLISMLRSALKNEIAHRFPTDKNVNVRYLETVFDNANMNTGLVTQKQLASENAESKTQFDFKRQMPKSFLPYIIQMAQENNVRIMFIRTKRRRDVVPNSQPPELINYISDLKEYLDSKKIELLDYTNNANIELKYFGEGDHMSVSGKNTKESGMKFFTEIFVKDMESYLNELKQ